MTDKKEVTEVQKSISEVVEVVNEAVKTVPVPTHFKVIITNTINDIVGEIFSRECEWGKKDTMMKSVRQKIRDLGTTIRDAAVIISDDKSLQTIGFTDLVITEKPKATSVKTSSSAQKNAKATVATETDIEILSIAHDYPADPITAKEIADKVQKELSAYTRHQLIHAFNTNLGEEEQDQRLIHYSTKVQAIESLLS